jgi:protein SCO1/2
MKTLNFKIASCYALSLMLLGACQISQPKEKDSRVASLPYYNEATFTPNWLDANSPELDEFHRIPSFKLINQNGDTISDLSLQNKVFIADFFFTTCPGICPKMTDNMSLVQEEFMGNNEVILLSHSVTPETDSVSVLKEYAINKGVQSGKWQLLTGSRETIYNLGRNAYFIEEDLGLEKVEDDFLHTENFVLIDKSKHIRGIYNGLNKSSVDQLMADVRTLLNE